MTPVCLIVRRQFANRRRPVIGGVGAILCLAIVMPLQASAQDGDASRAGLPLVLPTDTRALGLANAAAASTANEWATFTAPSQLAVVRRATAGLATEGYLASTRLSAAAVAMPLSRGAVGIGVTVLDYGSIQEVAASIPGTDGIETGRQYSAQDNAIVVGYGVSLSGRVRAGAAAEFLSTRIADLSGSGLAFSFGFSGSPAPGWDLAGSVQHLGADVAIGATRGALPTTVRFAASAPSRQVGQLAVRPMIEVRRVRGAGNAAAVAAEAVWDGNRGVVLVVRGGYTLRSGTRNDHAPESIGVGATLGSLTLDYALERFPTLDQVTHRIGLRVARPVGR